MRLGVAGLVLSLLIWLPASGPAIAEDIDNERIEVEVMKVLDEFMRSFTARDPIAHVATYHFPHYRLARGEMTVLETAEEAVRFHQDLFDALPQTGWDRSIWIHRQIINMNENKVHVNTQFRRLRADGSELGTYESLYVVIRKDGRWGIKLRSSFL